MATFEMDDQAFEAARARGERYYSCKRAVSARFDPARNRVIVTLEMGLSLEFDPETLNGLRGAAPADLAEVVVDGGGFTLTFPRLDADFGLPYLTEKYGARSDEKGTKVSA